MLSATCELRANHISRFFQLVWELQFVPVSPSFSISQLQADPFSGVYFGYGEPGNLLSTSDHIKALQVCCIHWELPLLVAHLVPALLRSSNPLQVHDQPYKDVHPVSLPSLLPRTNLHSSQLLDHGLCSHLRRL